MIGLAKALKAGGAFDGIRNGAKLHTDKDFASGDKTIKNEDDPLRHYLHELSVDIYGFEQEAPGVLHGAWELARDPQWAGSPGGSDKGCQRCGRRHYEHRQGDAST